jgi:protocatechuate 3,4-dioxygenase, beta subunit
LARCKDSKEKDNGASNFRLSNAEGKSKEEGIMKDGLAGNMDRRSFLRKATVFAVALPVVEIGALGLFGCNQARSLSRPASAGQPAEPTWKATIVADGEPGEPLIVSGTIFLPDGRTPLPNANLFVYQTDATGRYSTTGGGNRNTRIHGLMRTNSEGRYEFRTIKPGSYPASRNPAHIHAYVSASGYPEYWIDEYHFDDDPFVTSDMRSRVTGAGNFSSILKLSRGADGVLRGVRDIKIERCSRNCTGH